MTNEFYFVGITDLVRETIDVKKFRWTNGSDIGLQSNRLPWTSPTKMGKLFSKNKTLVDTDCVVMIKGILVDGPCSSLHKYKYLSNFDDM